MEHITEALQEIAKQQEGTSLSKVSGAILNLEPDEKKIVELKYISKPFGAMTLPDRTKWTKALLLKISIITGWIVPDNEALNVLVDQFEKKLNESYPTVNPDEVEYAFRNAGTTVQDWGKQINLSLIDQVMIPFIEKRFEVSRKEEQQKLKKLPMTIENISDMQLWDSTMEFVKRPNASVHLIPPGLYEWADKNGNINTSRDEKHEYMERAILVHHSELAAKYEKNPHSLETKKELNDFNKMREEKKYSIVETIKLQELAKKMIVFDMMKKGN